MATYNVQENSLSISNISYGELVNEPIDAVTVSFPSRRIAGAISDINLVSTYIDSTGHVNGTVVTHLATEGGIPAITLAFVAGTGDTDNGSFAISGDNLSWDSTPATGSKAIRVKATDANSVTYEEALTFTVV